MKICSSPIKQNNSAPSFGYSFFMKDVPAPCAYCGRKMLSISNVNHFADTFAGRKGKEAIEVLRTFMPRLDKKEQLVVNQLTSAISAEPQTKITSILASLANRYEYATNQRYADAIEFSYKRSGIRRDSHLGRRIEEIIESSQKSVFRKPNTNTEQRILRITDLQEGLQDYIKRTQKPENAKKIKAFLATINGQFANIKQDPHTFFAKFGYDSPRGFMGSLLASIRSTADHIVLASQGGACDMSNYLAVCGKCNWTRGNSEFRPFINADPRRVTNIRKQFTYLDSNLAPSFRIRKHGNEELKEQIAEYLPRVQVTIESQLGFPLRAYMPTLEKYRPKKISVSPLPS